MLPSISWFGHVDITPYVLLMALFLLEAQLIQFFVPFYKDQRQHNAESNHFVELDGLRGLLALGVFFSHAVVHFKFAITGRWAQAESHFYAQMGVACVAMFFLITGFLFWSKALNGTLGHWIPYLGRRISRLLPAYLFAVLLITCIVALRTGFELMVPFSEIFLSLLSFLTFQLVPGPPPNGFEGTPLIYASVFWSLRVEWMFYISLIILAPFAKSARRQLFLLLGAVGLYFALPILVPLVRAKGGGSFGLGTIQYFIYYLLSYFLIGMTVAFVKQKCRLKTLFCSHGATVVGLAAIILIFSTIPAEAGFLEGVALGIPFLFVVHGNSFLGVLRLKPLLLLGQISYSTYLLHGIVLYCVFVLGRESLNISSLSPLALWSLTAATGLVVVALSALSYRFFEAPFLRQSGRAHSEPIVALKPRQNFI